MIRFIVLKISLTAGILTKGNTRGMLGGLARRFQQRSRRQ